VVSFSVLQLGGVTQAWDVVRLGLGDRILARRSSLQGQVSGDLRWRGS